jgi:thymidylate synthase (FAD)
MTTQIIHYGDEGHILYIARVSSNQENTNPGLLGYLIKHNHWSPFEMVGACFEIQTTRDIGRQILRHRSFSFQEFSQRYAVVDAEGLSNMITREMRMKGSSNRQGSLPNRSPELEEKIRELAEVGFKGYHELINLGVAPECARSILPEGYAPTKLYMNGTLRSWIHYIKDRTALNPEGIPYAQREHYRLAVDIWRQLANVYPVTFQAIEEMEYFPREQIAAGLKELGL